MIRELAESKENVLAFEITGKVSEEEEKVWIERFDKVLEEHDKVSVLLILGENASWGTKAGYEDIKWLISHMKRFDKIAIVTDSTIWKWLIALDSQFAKLVGIGEKHFESSEVKEALEWVNA
jgi:phage terminase large subunit-like protein